MRPLPDPVHPAVTSPWVPLQLEGLQLRRTPKRGRSQLCEVVLRQVEVAQGGDGEVAQKGEGGEGVRVEAAEPVPLQLQDAQGGEALEGVRVEVGQVVVVEVEAGERPQAVEGRAAELRQLVVAQLQHLGEGRRGERE